MRREKMRRKKRGGRLLKLMAAILMFAVSVRVLASGGAGKRLEEKLAVGGDFVRYALASESALVQSEADGRLWQELIAETSIVPAEKTKEPETAVEKEAKRESLVVWEYTPGGEKKANTYPIENTTISPKSEKGYVRLGNIWVKNDSTKGIDLKWLLGAKLPFQLTGKGPHVLIVHTHGSECYFPQGRDSYTLDDVERTSDKRYNMIRVGDELEAVLKAEGVSVIHDRNIYDSPSYNGSYTRTLSAIGEALKKNPSIKVVIDVHRDAMTSADGVKYRTVADVNGERVAQLMLVMSTGESGLPHPDWAENLKLAVKLQNAMATKYPGIMRPMNLRKERFNMHATKGSMLVEVGTSANSLAEAIASVKLLGKELANVLKTAK